MAVSYLSIHIDVMVRALVGPIARNIFTLMMTMCVCNVTALKVVYVGTLSAVFLSFYL